MPKKPKLMFHNCQNVRRGRNEGSFISICVSEFFSDIVALRGAGASAYL
jgi:hypothetical protein